MVLSRNVMPADAGDVMAAPSPRISHADSRVLVYWLRKNKSLPHFVYPLDRFYKMTHKEVSDLLKSEIRMTVSESEILSALSPQ